MEAGLAPEGLQPGSLQLYLNACQLTGLFLTLWVRSNHNPVGASEDVTAAAVRAERTRFHSALIDVTLSDGRQIETALTLQSREVIADSGAGKSYLPPSVAKLLGIKTKRVATVSMKTADGSPMVSPDQAAVLGLQFTCSSEPGAQYRHEFLFHKAEQAPAILGNDFWFKHRAVFNYPMECIQLMNEDGTIQNSIPFRCARQSASDMVAAAYDSDGKRAQRLIPVRATEDMILAPNEGCVIQPMLDCPLGSLNRSDTLILTPELSSTRVMMDSFKAAGSRRQLVYCTPHAAVVPSLGEDGDYYTASTSVVNVGSEDLVINSGDLVAYATYLPEATEDQLGEELLHVQQQEVVAAAYEGLAEGKAPPTADFDGLDPSHPHYGKTGSQSIATIRSSNPKFVKWFEKYKDKLRIGDKDTPPWLKKKLAKLLFCYKEVFAENPSAPSAITGVEHSIDLLVGHNVVPRKERLRRCSPRELEAMFAETEKMLTNGIIQPSTSPWAANVIMVPKPSDPLGGLRYCVDYRYLNKCCISDCQVLPRIDDLLDSLAGAEVFSMMDAAAGFWGVKIKPEHRHLTAFNTWTHGQMEFVRMPFGLKNAPATMQRGLNTTLHPYTCDTVSNSMLTAATRNLTQKASGAAGKVWRRIASLYLDDVCVHGELKAHVDDLARVLKRLRGANVSLKMVKCEFGVTRGK